LERDGEGYKNFEFKEVKLAKKEKGDEESVLQKVWCGVYRCGGLGRAIVWSL
jgi:hypothetical protein